MKDFGLYFEQHTFSFHRRRHVFVVSWSICFWFWKGQTWGIEHDPTVKCAVLEAGYIREATRIFKEGLEKCLALYVRLKCTPGNWRFARKSKLIVRYNSVFGYIVISCKILVRRNNNNNYYYCVNKATTLRIYTVKCDEICWVYWKSQME